MTWLLAPLAAGIVGFALGRWTRARRKVVEREPDMSWPGKPLRVIDHGPADLPYWAGDRKP